MPHDLALHARIIRLARSGSLDRAWALLEDSGLAAAQGDPEALTLRARLVKDRAKRATGGEAARLYAEASSLYEAAVARGHASYPLINAASLSLLAGKRDRAAQLACRVLDLLEADPDEAETRYWLGATRAEALLLLDRLPEARAALRTAVAEAPLAWEDRAATIGQFALICRELACDAGWLDQFRPPRSIQYSGIMAVGQSDASLEARIAEWLETENVGFGFGALAAGADIWIAEALLARSAALNVILPCPVEVFREKSVAAVDTAWLARFDRLLAAADSVDELDAAPAPSSAAVKLTDAVALGLAVHNARILQSEPLRLRIASTGKAREIAEPGPVRMMSLPAARRPGSEDFHVGETGVGRAMLRAASAADADNTELFDSPTQAWSAARLRIRAREPVAFDYRFTREESPDSEATARLDAIADVMEHGQALASKAFAFALLAEMPEIRVETMGEIRAASGYFPIFALG